MGTATQPSPADDRMAAELVIAGMDLDTIDFVLRCVSRYGEYVDEMLERRHLLTHPE